SYSVVLEPTRVGEFVIPQFSAKIKGESFSSQPLKLKVVESDPSAPPPAYASKTAFLWVVLPKTNLFINEPMVAEFRLYFRSEVRRYGNLQLPLQGNGLTFSKLVEGPSFQRR